MVKLMDKVNSKETQEFSLDNTSTLRFKHRLCVPNVPALRRGIMEEGHSAAYVVHPGTTKMYQDLRQVYWSDRTKRDVVDFVSRCLTC